MNKILLVNEKNGRTTYRVINVTVSENRGRFRMPKFVIDKFEGQFPRMCVHVMNNHEGRAIITLTPTEVYNPRVNVDLVKNKTSNGYFFHTVSIGHILNRESKGHIKTGYIFEVSIKNKVVTLEEICPYEAEWATRA